MEKAAWDVGRGVVEGKGEMMHSVCYNAAEVDRFQTKTGEEMKVVKVP